MEMELVVQAEGDEVRVGPVVLPISRARALADEIRKTADGLLKTPNSNWLPRFAHQRDQPPKEYWILASYAAHPALPTFESGSMLASIFPIPPYEAVFGMGGRWNCYIYHPYGKFIQWISNHHSVEYVQRQIIKQLPELPEFP